MTEAEWLACEDPERLYHSLVTRLSDRKCLLFAVACCSLPSLIGTSADDLQGRLAEALGAAAGFADGLCEVTEVRRLWGAAPGGLSLPEQPRKWAYAWTDQNEATIESPAPSSLVHLLRDVFGNPFRSVTADPAWLTSDVV